MLHSGSIRYKPRHPQGPATSARPRNWNIRVTLVALLALLAACSSVQSGTLPTSAAGIGLTPLPVLPSQLHGHLTDAPHVAGEILVRFRHGLTAGLIARLHSQYGGQEEQDISQLDLQRVRVPVGQEDAILAAYRANPNVLYAEPNYTGQATYAPNDPYYYTSGYTNCHPSTITNQYYLPIMNASTAWDQYLATVPATQTIIVADVDSGIDTTHPDLQGKYIPGYNFVSNNTNISDDYGHGTMVGSEIAAATNDGIGMASLGLNSITLMPVKAMDAQGNNTIYNVVQGILYAGSHGAKVINVSIAFAIYAQSLQDAVNTVWNEGSIVVAASNNTGTLQNFYPAGMYHVLGVGATDPSDHLASFSSYGTMVGVVAPGTSIIGAMPTYTVTLNTTNNNCMTYSLTQGTSFALPLAASLIAMLMNEGMTNAQALQTVQQTSDNVSGTPNNGWDIHYGYGRIDAGNALLGVDRATTLGSVYGQVIDSHGLPIYNAAVSVDGQNVASGSDGMFRVPNLPAGSYAYTTTATAYGTVTGTVTVVAGADALLNPKMTLTSPYLFADTFDSYPIGGSIVGPAVNLWSSTQATGAGFAMGVNAPGFQGGNALQFNLGPNGNGSAYATQTYPMSTTTHDVSFNLLISSTLQLQGKTMGIINVTSTAAQRNTGDVGLYVGPNNVLGVKWSDSNGTWHYFATNYVLTLNQWYSIELAQTAGMTTGSWSVWVFGQLIASQQGINTGSAAIQTLMVGDDFTGAATGITGTFYVDNVVAATTSPTHINQQLFSETFDTNPVGSLPFGSTANLFTGGHQSGTGFSIAVTNTTAASLPNALGITIGSAGGSAWAYKVYTTTATTHDMRTRVYLSPGFSPGTADITLMQSAHANAASPGTIVIKLVSTNNVLEVIWFDSNGTRHLQVTTTSLTPGQWYTLEVQQTNDPVHGMWSLFVNGKAVASQVGIDMSNLGISAIGIGDSGSVASATMTGTMWIDDVASATGYIGQ